MMVSPNLSIVIPAYNEEKRLPKTLERLYAYLPTLGITWEIVIVDDGSSDGTVRYVRSQQPLHPELRLLSDGINRGRGAAVRLGMIEARGELILEADSDGSVADEAIGRFLRAFERDTELMAVFGSRELPESRIVQWQPWGRVFLGYGFLFLARAAFLMWRVTDFTLGFKMFRRDAARDIFARQFDPHFFAEAEIVFVTHKRGFRCIELPVTWTDDPDSRIRPLRDVARTLRGMGAVLWRWVRGEYTD